MESSFKVYVICCKLTKEVIYVGRTSLSLEKRWWWHTQHSSQFINTYMQEHGGFNEFSIELLKECQTYSDHVEWESHFILEMEPKCNILGIYKPPESLEYIAPPIQNKNWPLIHHKKQKYKKNV